MCVCPRVCVASVSVRSGGSFQGLAGRLLARMLREAVFEFPQPQKKLREPFIEIVNFTTKANFHTLLNHHRSDA